MIFFTRKDIFRISLILQVKYYNGVAIYTRRKGINLWLSFLRGVI